MNLSDTSHLDKLKKSMKSGTKCFKLVEANYSLYYSRIDDISRMCIEHEYLHYTCFMRPYLREDFLYILIQKILRFYNSDKELYLGSLGGLYGNEIGIDDEYGDILLGGGDYEMNYGPSSTQLLGGDYTEGSVEYLVSLAQYLHIIKTADDKLVTTFKKIMMNCLWGYLDNIELAADKVPNFPSRILDFLTDNDKNSKLSLKPPGIFYVLESNHPELFNTIILYSKERKYKVGWKDIISNHSNRPYGSKYISELHFTVFITRDNTLNLRGHSMNGPYFRRVRVRKKAVQLELGDEIHVFDPKLKKKYPVPVYIFKRSMKNKQYGRSKALKICRRRDDPDDEERNRVKKKVRQNSTRRRNGMVVFD